MVGLFRWYGGARTRPPAAAAPLAAQAAAGFSHAPHASFWAARGRGHRAAAAPTKARAADIIPGLCTRGLASAYPHARADVPVSLPPSPPKCIPSPARGYAAVRYWAALCPGLRPIGPARRRWMAGNAGHMRARMTVLVHVPAAAFNLEDFSIDHPRLASKSRVGGQDPPGLASKSRVGGQDHPWAVMRRGPPPGSDLPLL